jgi:hypothetical protein
VIASAGLAAATAVLGGVALAGSASAHDYIVSTSPAADSTQTKPISKVVLTYDDLVLDPQHNGSTSVVQVTDASGRHFETDCASVLDRNVTVPASLGGAGKYTVSWRIVSADGHPVSGSYDFTYAPPAGASAAPGSNAPACGHSTATAASTASASGSSSVSGVLIGVVGGVVVLVIVAAVVLMARRGRREPRGIGDDATGPTRPE